MDLYGALRDLYEEKKKLDVAIATLEAGMVSERSSRRAGRRGRKNMSPEERLVVSQRMRAYWQTRRGRAAEAREGSPPVSI